MKAITAVCSTGASVAAISANGRISRPHHPHRGGDGENAEIKMYLSKLKDLVPFMPRNRKLSKLEIIQHVIDYICELQTELETHPEIDNFNPNDALNLHEQEMPDDRIFQNFNEHIQTSNPITRQPLVVRQTPNTILSPPHHHNNPIVAANNNNGNTITTSYTSHTMSDKSTTDNGHSRSHC